MAGAKHVFAVTRGTRYGSVAQVTDATLHLARAAECAKVVSVISHLTPQIIFEADVVTNSGHVRPIDGQFVRQMKPSAVVSLMYEAWEYRETDVDIRACRERRIRIAGTNERHPAVAVFSYLGMMAIKLLLDAGIAVYGSRILVICDNPFASFIERGLRCAGATVEVVADLGAATERNSIDAVLIALRPTVSAMIGAKEASRIAECWPGAVLVQFWGDIDRAALAALGLAFWPERAPGIGHMAILPSDIGAEPVVRLQSGGLKVAEALMGLERGDPHGWEFVDEL
jgi:hypothetical protein